MSDLDNLRDLCSKLGLEYEEIEGKSLIEDKSLVFLNLDNQKIEVLPSDSFSNFINLKRLQLSGNMI